MRIVMVVPCPTSLAMCSVPPCAEITPRAIAKPMPSPAELNSSVSEEW